MFSLSHWLRLPQQSSRRDHPAMYSPITFLSIRLAENEYTNTQPSLLRGWPFCC